MLVYLILYFTIISIYILLYKPTYGSIKITKNQYLCIIFIILALFIGLRDISVGRDVESYLFRYINAKILLNHISLAAKDGGFLLLTYFFCEVLKVNFHFFVLIISTFCIYCIIILIKQFSRNTLISLIVWLSIGNLALFMSGIRQAIAISISSLSIIYIIKRKKLQFIILILIASTIHKSALVFIPVYYLYGIKLNRKASFTLLLTVLFCFILKENLSGFIQTIRPQQYRYLDFYETHYVNPLVVAVPIVFCLYFAFFITKNQNNTFFYILSCIYLVFTILSLENNQYGRLSYYFSSGIMISSAAAIEEHKQLHFNSAIIVESLMITLCILYFFISAPGGTLQIDNYKFFFLR